MARDDKYSLPDGTEVVLGDVGQEIVFENEQVRVWEIMLHPGTSQPWHQHHNPYLVIALEAASNRIQPAVGEPREVHESAGGIVYREPGEVHMLTNYGETPYKSRLVELRMLGENQEQEHTHG